MAGAQHGADGLERAAIISATTPDSSARVAGRKLRLVVIGNGMAPGRALERLFEAAPDAYDVTIFNAEPRVNYDRIMLSPILSAPHTSHRRG